MYMHHFGVWYSWKPEEGTRSLKLGLQMVVILYRNAGNRSHRALTTEPSLQPIFLVLGDRVSH